ncbi:MAG TPA: hypothetical protein VFS14_00780 [Candidatus Saccharimonadales bacterium]|nr:hypothetical protein [Candidatus Saccharimonadales bacterium]
MALPSIKKAASSALLVLRSTKFFYGVVALLVIQAIWMTLTARYPMAFDEDFHFGIIQIYSHQWSPFITNNPPDSGAYGDLVRNTSLLYHYLMSFPYRLIALFTQQEMVQVVALRFLNIAMFAGGLFVFRAVFSRLRFSPIVTNFSLLMIVLIPVVPFLAGQINYDNLMFLLVPLITLIALRVGRAISSTGKLPLVDTTALLSLCMLTSLVKYAFLPVFLAVLLYPAILIIRHKNTGSIFKRTWSAFITSTLPLKLTLVGCLVITSGLFIERYGVNVVQYGDFQPDCDQVESIEHCSQYGPFERNRQIAATVKNDDSIPYDPAPILFVPEWIGGMMHRLYFAINYDYFNYYGLPVPILTAYIVGGVGFILCCFFFRRLFKNRELYLILAVAVVYTGAVFYVNLSGFMHLRQMLAINGRYLILILPFAFALMAAAYGLLIRKFIASKQAALYKAGLAVVVLLLTLQGGGILTFAVRSDPNWYWDNSFSQALGNGLKNISKPFIIGADHKERA